MELQDGSFAVNIYLLLNLGSTGQNTALEHGGKSWESYFEAADNAHHEQHFVFLFVLKTLWFQLKQRVRVYGQEGEQKFRRHRERDNCNSQMWELCRVPWPCKRARKFPCCSLGFNLKKTSVCENTSPPGV